jgi:hypothetical protein
METMCREQVIAVLIHVVVGRAVIEYSARA